MRLMPRLVVLGHLNLQDTSILNHQQFVILAKPTILFIQSMYEIAAQIRVTFECDLYLQICGQIQSIKNPVNWICLNGKRLNNRH